ncbi:MAG: 50S ribosomal protein L10 [SAR202 cluster bacterium]|nr:50S ribosomal protein L10 [SAR202 cluster bacterium]
MPTPQKVQVVESLTKRIADSTIAVSTDYSGMSVSDTNELRKMLRAKNVEYVIVKNTLAYIAADSADKSLLKEIISGPTGLVLGYGEVVDAVKTLTTFIKDSEDSDLIIRGALMGDRSLDIKEIEQLSRLPGKTELLAKLVGQLNGGIQGLVYVLNSPINGLANVLQRHVEATSEATDESPVEEEATSEATDESPVEEEATSEATDESPVEEEATSEATDESPVEEEATSEATDEKTE